MSNAARKCPICGAEQKEGETTVSVELGFGVVVVRHVPASVCERCGEETIADDVAAALEGIVAQARQRERTVEVVQYKQEAPYAKAS